MCNSTGYTMITASMRPLLNVDYYYGSLGIKVSLFERPNDPSSGFCPSGGSLGIQERKLKGASLLTRGVRAFHRGFGQRESINDGQRNIPQPGTLGSRAKGALPDGAGPKVTYVPPSPPDDERAIFAHYQTGINFDKYDENIVEVSGLDCPTTIMSFADIDMAHTLTVNIAKAGYSKPTPVQKYSIPIILAGRDLMACAQTGSGKTAAFLVPVVAQMMRDGVTASSFKEQQEPECIITAPTRELVNQIFLEARKFVHGFQLKGEGRVHVKSRVYSKQAIWAASVTQWELEFKLMISLRNVKYLVLDEADRMLDMGFGLEMKKLISFPHMPQKDKRQTLMFSATFPEEVQRDREQREREIALQDFRSGRCPVLVATSVAARGLDIESVQHVINFDLPSTIEEYVHRIGRTGRCGNTGKAVSFFDNNSNGHLAPSLIKVLSDAQQVVPLWLEEIALEFERGRPSVNTQESKRGRDNMNPRKMEYSATEVESWD
ncbi:putative ATP-dependent RNA helicase DDX4 [Willisornis vidua]|uniref:RNA helicase n=1 Tax=Willisornis vidua TaxID=1566151 RepID=A0ABQ9DPU1_9PASS|nr:putative ATP-dependent RNA helicase DDX4 [Willisornis vidua]